jgi:hypothetical protein
MSTTAPHPLEPVVRDAFRGRSVHDRVTLACHLKGCTHLSGGGDRAYLKVAEDVLGYMESQGKLTIDAQGWHRRAPMGGPS